MATSKPTDDPHRPDPSRPERFVWPPGPRDLSPTTVASKPSNSTTPRAKAAGTPTPRPTPETAPATPSPNLARGPSAQSEVSSPLPGPSFRWHRAREAALEVERFWLGMEAAPLLHRVRACAGHQESDLACPRCGGPVGAYEAGEDGCQSCAGERLPWKRLVRLGQYEDDLREAIQELKFGAWRRIGDELGQLLGRRLAEEAAAAGIPAARIALVPVPTTFRRRMGRGVDHTLVLARGMARAGGFEIVRALHRRHGPSQLDVPPSRRRANVAGVYRVRRRADLGGRVAVLVDDVRTSGATLRSCGSVLRRGVCRGSGRIAHERRPAEIWATVVGVAADHDRRAPNDGRPEHAS